MKKLLKLLVYMVVMLALILFFLPKINLYYAAEGFMQEKKVFISDENIADRGFYLELNNANFLFDKLELAEVEKITVSTLLFYNALSIDKIHVNEGFSDFLPLEIETISAEHAIYNPTHVTLKGESEDSYFYGDVDLIERVLNIHLRLGAQSEKRYKSMLGKLTKEEGGYVYEYKF